jgi:hypothetical protein
MSVFGTFCKQLAVTNSAAVGCLSLRTLTWGSGLHHYAIRCIASRLAICLSLKLHG